MSASQGRNRSIAVVWLVIFLDLLGFGIVIPSLAYYVAAYPIPGAAIEAGALLGITDPSAIFVGMLQTAYSGLQLFAAPAWGRLSDRIGRKPVLLVSVAGFSAAWLAFAWAPTVLWLVATRALAGLFGANISTAQAYMADAFPPDKRAKGMGLIGMAFGLGFVLGPLAGALLASDTAVGLFTADAEQFDTYRRVLPAVVAAGLSAAAFITGVVFLKEARSPGATTPAPASPTVTGLRGRVARLLLVYFTMIFGFAGIETMFSQFNLQVLGVQQQTNSLVFAVVGITMAVVQGGLIGKVTRRFGSHAVLRFGLVGLGGFMFLYGAQGQLQVGLWGLIFISAGMAACLSLANPSVLALVSEASHADRQGAAMGVTSSAATLGRALGPLLAGVLFARLGPDWPFTVGAMLIWLSLLSLPRRVPVRLQGPDQAVD